MMIKHKVKKAALAALISLMSTSAWGAAALTEAFESDPAARGWSVVDNIAGPVTWVSSAVEVQPDHPFANASGLYYTADSDNHNGYFYDTELRTPVLDLSEYSRVLLHFAANHNHYTTEFFDVDVSTDGGGSWTNALRWQEDHFSEDVALDLSSIAAGHSNVMVRFHYYSGGGNWDWYIQIDNVVIDASTPVPLSDGAKALLAFMFAAGAFYMTRRRRLA